jgi:hypothetical protein
LCAQQFEKVATIKLLRERMTQCYRVEGVNHKEKCKEFAESYMQAIGTLKQGGVLWLAALTRTLFFSLSSFLLLTVVLRRA